MPIFSLDRSGPDGFFKGKADIENIGLIRKIVQNNQRRSKKSNRARPPKGGAVGRVGLIQGKAQPDNREILLAMNIF